MTDDIVDDDSTPKEVKREKLEKWKSELDQALRGKSDNEVLTELNQCIKHFDIPHEPFFDLIEGMEIDLEKDRFSTFEELKNYCIKAASTIGLMTIPIFGYEDESAKDYAINLGIAMQLTNIIRDVKSDSLRGRIYIPQRRPGEIQLSRK